MYTYNCNWFLLTWYVLCIFHFHVYKRVLPDLCTQVLLFYLCSFWHRAVVLVSETLFGKTNNKQSGQARCNLTPRQKWVKANLGFPKQYIVHRPQSTRLGHVLSDMRFPKRKHVMSSVEGVKDFGFVIKFGDRMETEQAPPSSQPQQMHPPFRPSTPAITHMCHDQPGHHPFKVNRSIPRSCVVPTDCSSRIWKCCAYYIIISYKFV